MLKLPPNHKMSRQETWSIGRGSQWGRFNIVNCCERYQEKKFF